ncbi:TetR/AcrR family transcriptional regulator [Streptomyces sp. NPDC089919]|uniref:TetR/AcrR family transcriptional regulator n=1 Tax=Streptomyces sp. NPDC089919 TaxID=3155188 RepID=UPI0034126DA1
MKDKPVETTRRPAGRAGYHHGSLPGALVATALELLDEQGPDRVTVREVARRAGVSPAAPFRHFADRAALLTAVADRVLADYEQWLAAAVATGRGPRMRDFGLGFLRYALAHPHRFALIRPRVFGPTPDAALRPRLAGIETTLTELIRADQQAGVLRPGDPELVGLAGQALVYGLTQMFVDGHLPAEGAEQLAEQVLTTFGLGIVGPGATGPGSGCPAGD